MAFDFSEMPRLETERLVLREIRPQDDLADLYDLFADPMVANNTDTEPFATMDDAVAVMDWIGRIFADRQGMRWAIALRGQVESLIGTCGYNIWRPRNHCAEIGYDLAQRHWGNGIMTEALTEMISFGFSQMDLNRIEADVTVGNERSVRVLVKLGFQEEGLLRQRGYFRGEYHDLRFFSLLREDWED